MERSSGNSSFIPKRGTSSRRRKVRGRSVQVVTLGSYIVLFAVLVASAAVYAYSQFVSNQLQGEIAAMNGAVENFNEADMQKVLQFDNRLRQAEQRLNSSVSVSSILTALEEATVNIVRFESLNIVRNFDQDFYVEGSMEAGSFNTTLFQRGIFDRNNVVEAVEITNLELLSDDVESGGTPEDKVLFTARLAVPLASVPYRPAATPVPELVPEVAEEVAVDIEQVSDEAVQDETEAVDVITEENI